MFSLLFVQILAVYSSFKLQMRILWSPSGKSLTLPCALTLPDEEKYSIEWRKDGKLIFSAFTQDNGHAAPELQGRLGRAPPLGLTIHSIELNDEGVYQCVLTRFSRTPTRPEFGIQMKIVVNSAPRIVRPPDGLIQYHLPSTSLSIECVADGNPPPEITWIKDEATISANSTLSITQLGEDDKGDYICQAQSSEGQTSSRISLRFAKPTTIDYAPSNKTVNEGANVFWNCHASAFPENVTYSWKYNGKPIRTTDVGLRATVQEAELSISPIRPTDTGWYACEADNRISKPATSKAYLQVNYRPTIHSNSKRLYTISLGSRVDLLCQADAQPPVESVLWTKNGVYLKTTNGTNLVFHRSTDGDAGVYGCEAMNSVGRSDPFEIHLVIAESPRFSTKPPPLIYSKEGGSIEVECNGFGDPIPIQYWLRNRRRISSPKLSLPTISHSDHGLYTCVITNSVATVQSEMRLYVQNTRPQASAITSVQCLGEDGLVVDWNPGYDAGLPQTFTIHYENVDLNEEKGTLQTKETHAELFGLSRFSRYRLLIEARNSEGSINSSYLEKNVCSKLVAPLSMAVINNMVSWERSEGAQLYRLEYRGMKSDMDGFVEMAEVISPPFLLPSKSMSLTNSPEIELRVRALRPNYTQSAPSDSIFYRRIESSHEPTLWWMAAGGGLFLFLFFLLFVMARRNGYCGIKRKRKKKRLVDGQSVYDREHAPGDSYIDGSTKIMEDRRDSGNWSGSRNDALNGLLREPYSYDELEIECSSAVEEMFREQYLYGIGNGLGKHGVTWRNGDVQEMTTRTALLDDLRIERLKRELKQSQI